jgi:predicted nucleotidyltransferase
VEQNISSEILLLLVQEELHVRGLAGRLGTNHTTVLRRLQKLVKENAIDKRTEGKNTVYFVKKTIEGRNRVMMAEYCRLSRLLKRYPYLRAPVKTLMAHREIPLALVFGSHAKGTATERSDIDVFLETKEKTLKQELEKKYPRLSVKIGDFDPASPLVREMMKGHVIVKGVERYYDATGFWLPPARRSRDPTWPSPTASWNRPGSCGRPNT